MEKISAVKGFADHLPQDAAIFTRMGEVGRRIFKSYGYKEIQVPILEYTELFARSIGVETDVVQKEMFTFPDRKGRSLTMRPEATAGIMRAYIEHAVYAREGLSKFFSFGPMFRYERPQKGRLRQFYQIDCELLGAQEPQADAEVLLMLMGFMRGIGLEELDLDINNLGCKACRPKYREQLKKFFDGLDKSGFCEDCLRRMDANVLRVLDCKLPRCSELSAGAPNLADNVCPECAEHFFTVRELLDRSGQAYRMNHRLVRGLDYYTRTTFEVVSGSIGAQSAVAGGGRYDGLVASLGGPEVPGIGFACGMERLALLMQEQAEEGLDFYLAVLDEKARNEALLLAQQLRRGGFAGVSSFGSGSAKSQLRQASRQKAKYCLILGGNELEKGTVIVKNMESGEQREENRAGLVSL